MSLYLKQMQLGPMQNFIYLVGDPETKECGVIDPAWDVGSILRQAEKDGMRISKILISHGHPDHTNGVESLLERIPCSIYYDASESNRRLREVRERASNIIYVQKREWEWMRWRWPGIVQLEDGDTIHVGKVSIKVIHTPGHTPGSQCFHVGNVLLSGDTLFISGCGRVDLPGSNPEEMYESLMKLRGLDDGTVLYPGHNYADKPTSTMGEEKKRNPYLHFDSAHSFVKAVTGAGYGY